MIESVDSIVIELVVTACKMDEKVWMHGELEIFVNGEKPYNEGDYIIDTEALFASMIKNGEYFIFSCCCGVPECSGWSKGIKVLHQEHKINWVDETFGRNWIFDKEKILFDLKSIKEDAIFFKQYFTEKGIDYVGVGYTW